MKRAAIAAPIAPPPPVTRAILPSRCKSIEPEGCVGTEVADRSWLPDFFGDPFRGAYLLRWRLRANGKAALSGPSIRRPAELRERFVGILVVRADLVDAPGFLAGGNVASELARDAHHLLDLLHRRHAFAFAFPQIVLDTHAHVQAERDSHGADRRHRAHERLDRQHGPVGAAAHEFEHVGRMATRIAAAEGHV